MDADNRSADHSPTLTPQHTKESRTLQELIDESRILHEQSDIIREKLRVLNAEIVKRTKQMDNYRATEDS